MRKMNPVPIRFDVPRKFVVRRRLPTRDRMHGLRPVTGASAKSLMEEIIDLINSNPVPEGAKLFSRDELHERD